MEACGYAAPDVADRRVGELVMAVGCVVGTTYTGDIDDVAGIDRMLSGGGWDIPIHVDAASGGFILPFTEAKDADALLWDFRLAHVLSINVSNHKYGLVYPGLGTVVFRDATVVPDGLLIDIDYLSGEMRNYSLNFSRASSGVILQYYNFLRLGRAGYRRVMEGCLDQARFLRDAIETSPLLGPRLAIVNATGLLPILTLRLADGAKGHSAFALQDVAKRLEASGWFAPVYHLPPNNDRTEVMRIVVRAHFNRALASAFLQDLEAAVRQLDRQRPGDPPSAAAIAP
jgi:glutamate decarboxylase